MSTTTKTPRLKWRIDEDGDHWAATKRPLDTLFSICIDAPAETLSRKWEIVLSAWVGKADDPLISQRLTISARRSREKVLAKVPQWKADLLWDTYVALQSQAAHLRELWIENGRPLS